ncbi:hypothetical protein ACE02P_18145 [Shewanella bicestrii]
MKRLSVESQLEIDFHGEKLSFPMDKSLTVCVGQSRSGKSVLLAEMARKFLKQGLKVICVSPLLQNAEIAYLPLPAQPLTLTVEELDQDDLALCLISKLQGQYPEQLTYYSIHPNQTMDAVKFENAILLIDDAEIFWSATYKNSIQGMLREAKQSILFFQDHSSVVRNELLNHYLSIYPFLLIFLGSSVAVEHSYSAYIDCPEIFYKKFQKVGGYQAIIDSMPNGVQGSYCTNEWFFLVVDSLRVYKF